MEGMREAAKRAGSDLIVQGCPSVFNTAFGDRRSIDALEEYKRCDQPKQQRFLSALLERGIRPTSRGTWFVSAAHTEAEVGRTLEAVQTALKSL